MQFLIRHVRGIIYFITAGLALSIYVAQTTNGAPADQQYLALTQDYAIAALTFLYLTLLISPVYLNFPLLPFRGIVMHSRRALGLSAFFFSILHTYYAFFKLLLGFPGLRFLGSDYILGISTSFAALIILTALAVTSFDYAEKYLGNKWKIIHRFVYLAGFLIIFHTLLLGSDFASFSSLTSEISSILLIVLLSLEATRFDRYFATKFSGAPRFGPGSLIVSVIIVLILLSFVAPSSPLGSLNVHAKHLREAQ